MNKLFYILLGVVIASSGTVVFAGHVQNAPSPTTSPNLWKVLRGEAIEADVIHDTFEYLNKQCELIIEPPICNGPGDKLQWTGSAFTCMSLDRTAPIIRRYTAVPTPSRDTTPSYTFHSSEAGTISYSGACTSPLTTARRGYTTTTFEQLDPATYNNCKIYVTDQSGNKSNVLSVNNFLITPTIAGIRSPSNTQAPEIINGRVNAYYIYPSYLIRSNKAGSVTVGGSCATTHSPQRVRVGDNNLIGLYVTQARRYSDCTVTLTDNEGNKSNVLRVPSFTITTRSPVCTTELVTTDNVLSVANGGCYRRAGGTLHLTLPRTVTAGGTKQPIEYVENGLSTFTHPVSTSNYFYYPKYRGSNPLYGYQTFSDNNSNYHKYGPYSGIWIANGGLGGVNTNAYYYCHIDRIKEYRTVCR